MAVKTVSCEFAVTCFFFGRRIISFSKSVLICRITVRVLDIKLLTPCQHGKFKRESFVRTWGCPVGCIHGPLVAS